MEWKRKAYKLRHIYFYREYGNIVVECIHRNFAEYSSVFAGNCLQIIVIYIIFMWPYFMIIVQRLFTVFLL